MRATWAAIGVVMSALSGCANLSGTSERPPQVVLGPVPTGELPAPLSTSSVIEFVPSTSSTTTTTVAPIEPLEGPIADAVSGNRVLVIGSRVLAATAPRNGGATCRVLTDFGWQVEMATEPGRFIEFGNVVLEQRLRPADDLDWDVIVVMLGETFDGDVDVFTDELDVLLDTVTPRPVLLYTVSELEPGQDEINDVIRSRAEIYPNIVIVDWAEATAAEPDILLEDGGPDPTSEGADRLALFMAAALGRPAGEPVGECLPPAFADDSAIVL